jgi:hypothetical protein
MICLSKSCVYTFLIVSAMCMGNTISFAREGKVPGENMSIPADHAEQFHWNEHKKLSWEDFRGPVKNVDDISAAATHCGIGFRTNAVSTGAKLNVTVYNNFYTNKSWVRADARIPSILDHEQGHFDLCEIYTRLLRTRMENFNSNVPDVKQSLMNIYAEVSSMYEARQQAYEQETTHGTNTPQQKRWQQVIEKELM